MRILWISKDLPYPINSGYPLRVFNLLRRMARHHEIWLVAFGTPEADTLAALQLYCATVVTAPIEHSGAMDRPGLALTYALQGKPVDLRFYDSPALKAQIRTLIQRVPFDLVLVDDSEIAQFWETLPKQLQTHSLLTFHDINFSKYLSISHLETKIMRRARLWLHGRMLAHWEPEYAGRYSGCITVSELDKKTLLAANPRLKIHVIPNGVDSQALTQLPDSNGAALLFVGNMAYRPNIDAVRYFAIKILPLVQRQVPQAEFWIAGRNPDPEVLALQGEGIHVTGEVEDITAYYRRSSLCVVPLRAGGGTRLKILEAMALGRAVITTTIGAEGLTATNGLNLSIADTTERFSEETIRLLQDSTARQQLAGAGRSLVEQRYDWEQISAEMERLCITTAGLELPSTLSLAATMLPANRGER